MSNKITKKHKRPNKSTISLKRSWLDILRKSILGLKLLMVTFCFLLFYTDWFDSYIQHGRNWFCQLTAEYGFKLENIIIQGQDNTSRNDIIESIGASKGTAIFAINIQKVKEQLENKAWIKHALVERKWPSTLYIAIKERKPIAIWQLNQKLYLVDSEGNRIMPYHGKGFQQLIHVVGPAANLYAKKLLQDIAQYPNLASKVISAVRYGNRRWNLNLEQDITVKMPEKGFNKAYEYLYLLDKGNKLFDQKYKMLDLRDHNKYYIH